MSAWLKIWEFPFRCPVSNDCRAGEFEPGSLFQCPTSVDWPVVRFLKLVGGRAPYLKVAMRHRCVIPFGPKWLRWPPGTKFGWFLGLDFGVCCFCRKFEKPKILGSYGPLVFITQAWLQAIICVFPAAVSLGGRWKHLLGNLCGACVEVCPLDVLACIQLVDSFSICVRLRLIQHWWVAA